MEDYRIACEVQYKGEKDCSEVRAFELAPELIQECINKKSYEPVIAYLENLNRKEIESFVPSTPLEKAVAEKCNIYEVNVRIEGRLSLESADDDFEPGVLTNTEVESDESCYPSNAVHVTGCYTFEVAAKTKKDAYESAQEVFDEHWDYGYVDCGDIENTDTVDRNGKKFCVVDGYSFESNKARGAEYGER